MAVCEKCGKSVEEDVEVCPFCGEPLKQETVQEAEPTQETAQETEAKKDEQPKNDFFEKMSHLNDTPDTTENYEEEDIENNKVMSIFAYLSWLVLIPLLAAKGSKFARFHCNQGLILAITEIVSGVVLGLLSMIPYVGWLFGLIEGVIGLACLILTVLGIVNAVNGKAKELPFVGKFRILK